MTSSDARHGNSKMTNKLWISVGLKIRRARFNHPAISMDVRFDGKIYTQRYPRYVENQYRISINGKYITSFLTRPRTVAYARELYKKLTET